MNDADMISLPFIWSDGRIEQKTVHEGAQRAIVPVYPTALTPLEDFDVAFREVVFESRWFRWDEKTLRVFVESGTDPEVALAKAVSIMSKDKP